MSNEIVSAIQCAGIGFITLASFFGLEALVIVGMARSRIFKIIMAWTLGAIAVGAMSWLFGLMICQELANHPWGL